MLVMCFVEEDAFPARKVSHEIAFRDLIKLCTSIRLDSD